MLYLLDAAVELDAYDLSAPRIHHAVAQAREKGYDKIIHYCTADVYKVGMSENFYDVVLAEDSLHHFSPLEKIRSSAKVTL